MNKIKSVLLVANGQAPNKQLLQSLVEESDCIIAADGGANICFKYNIYPDYIIGDFDSIDNNLRTHFKNSKFINKPEQDEHDLLKALKFCESLNPQKVICTSVFGNRIDHTFSNLFILQNQNFKFQIEYIDDLVKVFIIDKKHDFNLATKIAISFISYKPVFGITLKGFKYNLTDKDFPSGFNGSSNEIVKRNAMVAIKKGSLITILPHG